MIREEPLEASLARIVHADPGAAHQSPWGGDGRCRALPRYRGALFPRCRMAVDASGTRFCLTRSEARSRRSSSAARGIAGRARCSGSESARVASLELFEKALQTLAQSGVGPTGAGRSRFRRPPDLQELIPAPPEPPPSPLSLSLHLATATPAWPALHTAPSPLKSWPFRALSLKFTPVLDGMSPISPRRGLVLPIPSRAGCFGPSGVL
jgi:hypothetical protein